MLRTPATEVLPRWLGVVLLLVAIGLLLYVFSSANALFSAPPPALPTPAPTPAAGATPAPGAATVEMGKWIYADLAGFVKKLLALLLMCGAASFVGSLGIRCIFGPSPNRPARH